MKHQELTHEEVEKATKRFLEDGGLIRKLPNEIVPPKNLVGWRYGAYEDISGLYLKSDKGIVYN